MAREEYDVYLDGDPNAESTRRHMERVLSGNAPRRWPWLLGLVAGGTALAFWRARRTRREHSRDAPRPFAGSGAPAAGIRLSRAGGR
jgi:hypothetical protein